MKKGLHDKLSLTTGDIARLCGVHYRTATRWIDAGRLRAFHLPGNRGDRRVLPEDFVAFLQEHGLPIPKELLPLGKAVLVVEDDEQMAKAIQRVVRRAGFTAVVVADGFAAGVMAMSLKPAVITLDLRIPGIGGLALLKTIRSTPGLMARVLVVSAMPAEELAEALAAGADDVLEKPFKNKDLVDKVTALASGAQLPRMTMYKRPIRRKRRV